MRHLLHTLFAALLLAIVTAPGQGADSYDVIVYGGTPGGITSAISAAREGLSVVLLEQTKHVGGLSTSGLNRDEAEHMDTRTFGGLSEQFLLAAHLRTRGWTQLKHPNKRHPRTWHSHVAEKVFVEMLEQTNVPVRYGQLLERVTKKDGMIKELTVRGGTTYRAKVFIDSTYEGDLMAAAGVSSAVGREARDTYNESLGGVRYLDKPIKVSPYDENGKLLPGIMEGPPPKEFSASPHPICYNIRLNLTTDPNNLVEIGKPDNYDPKQYELLVRSLESGKLKTVGNVLALYGLPGGKRECNNKQDAIVSLSMPGEQTAWAEASFEERDAIHQKYRDYTHGLIWFLKTDPRVPKAVRKDMARYGLCKDEWADNGHWPYYLYIRAARRMKGAYVMTQSDITKNRHKKDVIHIGSHYIDSHHVARYAYDKEHFINEGRIWQEGVTFDIPYRAITPKKEECKNLLVPVCVSSSAVAFCAIRLEPTWMHLGEVSGIAASLAIRDKVNVQDVDVRKLQKKILQAGMPLKLPTATE
ncbi:MAG: FAD-dependent oxidoreductase [Verrucomicrobiae bacterium]|nr:FAD-dependent oxidoreductase [Verrucomicrobiae bacterium]NNJ87624.1 FAD-dependent oxidoreductase [Akkermansiaceae bacterium]